MTTTPIHAPAGGQVADFFAGVESRRHAWPAGRADLHWHVLFDEEVVERQLVEPYQAITHRPGLAPVPARWVHLTVLHAGPVLEYRPGEIDSITKMVRESCADLAPFNLIFGRPAIGTVAIECAAQPGAPARRLWELTAAVDAMVTGSRFPTIPATYYYPHVSLAYGAAGERRANRGELKAALADVAGGPLTLRATHLALVAQAHDRRRITWTPLATVPLGPSPRRPTT